MSGIRTWRPEAEPNMLGQYLPILALLVLGVLFAAMSFVASGCWLHGEQPAQNGHRTSAASSLRKDTPDRFPVRFFLVAMIFIVFDIEIIFLYPWATIFRQLGLFGLVAMFIFAFAVFESFVYLIGNGALDWGPIKSRCAASSSIRAALRTRPSVGLVPKAGSRALRSRRRPEAA